MTRRAVPVPVAASVAALVAALLLAGCSPGTPTPAARHTASPSASSAASSAPPSPVPTVEPAPTAPTPAAGRAGQTAFARHVMDVWGYALRTNDAHPLTALAGSTTCAGCVALTRELDKRRTQGWTVDFPGVTVRRVKVTRQGGVLVARSVVDIPETDSYNTDGSYRNTSPAHAGATFVVRMRYASRHYRLVSFTVS